MGSFQFHYLCFLASVILFLKFGTVESQPTYRFHYCQGSNYTSSSQFQGNLNLTLSSLSSNITVNKRFYNNSIGQNPDRVYGILLCRGDLTYEACKNCAETAIGDVTQRCPNKKTSISWYDDCMLRYSDKNIFSVMKVEPAISLYNTNKIKNPEPFYNIVSDLMNGLVRKATVPDGDSNKKFATGESNAQSLAPSQKLYGLVQCTPDISASDCNRCLSGAVGEIPSCCFGRPGGRVLRPSCHIRFEVYPFYKSTPGTAAPKTTITDREGKSSQIFVIIIVIASVTALILLSVITICFCSRKKIPYDILDGEIDDVKSLQLTNLLR